MKKKIFVLCLPVALYIGSCHNRQQESVNETPAINVAKVVTDSVTIYKTYPGILKANNSVDIMARVNGDLIAKHYNDGDLVRKGDLLFEIDDVQYRDAVRQAEAAYATAKSNYDYAEKQYTAMQKALKEDAIAVIQVNKAKNTLEQCRAEIHNTQAALQTANTNLSYCKIRAPFTGHITAPEFSVGAYISGEGAPVKMATLYEDMVLKANFNIDEDVAAKLRREDITLLDSIPMKFEYKLSNDYSGKLVYISPDVEESTGTLLLQADVDNRYGELSDGMYVSVNLPVESLDSALLVRSASLSTDQLGKYLYTVNDSNIVQYTPVKIGDNIADSMTVVVSGIDHNSVYVTKALLKVREGMRITPVFN